MDNGAYFPARHNLKKIYCGLRLAALHKNIMYGAPCPVFGSAPNKLKSRLPVITARAASQSGGLGSSASVSFILVCLCDAVCSTPAPTWSVLSITQQDASPSLCTAEQYSRAVV
jgi:hypothetical protein